MKRDIVEYKKSRDRLDDSIEHYRREISSTKPRAFRKRNKIASKIARNIHIFKSYNSSLRKYDDDNLCL